MRRLIRQRTSRCFLAAFFLAAGAVAAEPGLSDLGQGISAYNARDFAGAVSHLRPAQSVTALSDYVTYYLAWSQLLTNDIDGALASLNAYRAKPIQSSPLAGKISLVYGRALLDKRDSASSAKALEILQKDYKILPQPDGDFALGLAYEALSEQGQAALSYERVYYAFPNTELAAQSWTAMERLRTALGKDFPPATARQQLDRAGNWLAVKDYGKARQEYSTLAESLPEPEKDDAKAGIGITDYQAGEFASALRYLRTLHVTRPEADAQRLFYMAEAAHKMNDDAAMMEAVRELGEHYKESAWRLKALVSVGNNYLVTNDREKYLPLFKAAADTFPPDTSTAYSHWKVTWDAWLNDKPERAALLREQVEKYSDDSRAGTALYFLGRIAESNDKYGEARAYYDQLTAQFPHYYYAVLARQRMHGNVSSAAADQDVTTWLKDVDWPEHRDLSATEPNTATSKRIERARLLIGAGLQDAAESEIRFGAATDNEQPQLLALELAQSADSAYRALRVMKSFSSDYLSMPLDKAPVQFWQMLFPLPYKDEVFVNARERGLDPWNVAALIRQESEFNAGAKSRANAYGLMQLRPATGKMLGRQQGMSAVSTASLLNPNISIQLGTEYLRQQLIAWDGDLFRTLAAYNAGPGRVHQWLQWTNYREPAEFVESVPFTETKEYIQAVVRNADIYRELYGKGNVPVFEGSGRTPPVKLASLVRPPASAPHVSSAAPHHVSASVKASSVKAAAKPASQKVLVAARPASKKTAAKKAAVVDSSTRKKREPV
ncbi:MAG TPA: transglycosylase SLT domain-containing protein [Bryobacteraceae bacterium]